MKENEVNNKKDDNFLLYIPIKKHEEWELRGNKVYLIFHHNKPVERFMRWLVKKPSVSDIELDKIGSKTWQLIDGNRTVYDIGQELVNVFGNSCEPVYERLIMFLRYLNRKGWIYYKKNQ